MKNSDLLLSLILALPNNLGEVTALFQQAKSENRDITDAELESVFGRDAVRRAQLTLDIAKAKAAGK